MQETQETWVQSLGWEDPLKNEILQYSCLGNPMDRGTWQATVYGVTEELDTTGRLMLSHELLKAAHVHG